MLSHSIIRCFWFAGTLFLAGCASTSPASEPNDPLLVGSGKGLLPADSGWSLVWSDEFEQDGVPSDERWSFDEYPPLFYNQEIQAYTSRPENARVSNGRLVVEARKDGWEGYAVTSARLSSDLYMRLLYGRVEFRAKLPTGKGPWPGLWMLPTDPMGHGTQWPDSGEIDVMESVGWEGDKTVHASLHTAHFNHVLKTQISAPHQVDTVARWHVYAVEWFPDHIDFFVDQEKYLTFQKPSNDWRDWPFDKPYYLILNLAIGGTWGGVLGVDDSIFPSRMEVDYVRVYQNTTVPESRLVLP